MRQSHRDFYWVNDGRLFQIPNGRRFNQAVLNIRETGLLKSILKHCNKIQTKISTLTREQFDEDEDTREVICFNIFQIGELAKGFTPEFIAQYGGSVRGLTKCS